jgi:RNA ligase
MKTILKKYVEDGLIISQRHPVHPLNIYNYSQEVQFEKKWDEITLQCRGLVIDDHDNVVARPFKKFFNWEEVVHGVPPVQWLMKFEVFEKLDGSLGIGFLYKGEFIISTRGSFTSEQAIRASKIVEKYRLSLINDKDVYEATGHRFTGESLTFLFEIIYPENRIVVDYDGQEDLILIGAIHTESGEEVSYESLIRIAEILNCPVVKKHDALGDFESIKALNWNNREGVVVRFENGFRMKIKFEDYVALHRILTNCSSYDIWENLMTFGELPKNLFEKVPDEFYGWVRETRDNIISNYNWIDSSARAEYEILSKKLRDSENFDKDFALRIQDNRMSSLLFTLKKIDRKQGRGKIRENINGVLIERDETDEELLEKLHKVYSLAIWKKVKPDYSKPFAEKG